jgi:hypothetical protein
VDICLQDFRFIIGTDAYSRGSVSAFNRVPISLSQSFRFETCDYTISFSKSCYDSLLPLNSKTCNKKMKNFPVFYFSRQVAAIICAIDKIRCPLDNSRRIAIVKAFQTGAKGEKWKCASK